MKNREELIAHLGITEVAQMEDQLCFYQKDGCKGKGTHQCPKCKQWYCDEDYEMFLPIDNISWVETNLMCSQCHYEVYELPKFQEV